jgi:hypothetical protein
MLEENEFHQREEDFFLELSSCIGNDCYILDSVLNDMVSTKS